MGQQGSRITETLEVGEQLYDLGVDGGEQANLVHEAAWQGELRRMRAEVAEIQEAAAPERREPAAPPRLTPEEIEALRALGYLQAAAD